MNKIYSRRQFTGTMGMGALGVMMLNSCSKPKIETILHNANIFTSNPLEPKVQAIALSNGKIVAVGGDSDILHLASPSTEKIDIGGHTITPGFIDAHTHPAYSGRRHLRNVDCDLRSIAAIQQALKKQTGNTPPGKWISGFKYDDTKTAEGRYINRYDLDEVTVDHPVGIEHRGRTYFLC